MESGYLYLSLAKNTSLIVNSERLTILLESRICMLPMFIYLMHLLVVSSGPGFRHGQETRNCSSSIDHFITLRNLFDKVNYAK